LAHVEGPDRLQTDNDDDQVDHQSQDRAAYEEVGDFHERAIKFKFATENTEETHANDVTVLTEKKRFLLSR
jgi:hypothetical protein